MLLNLVLIAITIISQECFAFSTKIKSSELLNETIRYSVYEGTEFPLIVHVLAMPTQKIDLKLIPAIGQREEVSSIAQRNNAFIAINGANYRRGGKYNGNRVNLLYLNRHIYTDLQLIRGSFCWNSEIQKAVIDAIKLDILFKINQRTFPVDQINQPRIAGQSILYTDQADIALLNYTPGLNIIINNEMQIEGISYDLPLTIPNGWFVYQIDENQQCPIEKGVNVEINFNLNSWNNHESYNSYDFILGGAGLLMHNGNIATEHLYDEFSQGSAVVHCHDEIAADFHTRKMQEWLIELRHPRTAIGFNKDELYFAVIDGRQQESEGLTLRELALFMKSIGCTDALNIGGGGCATLYIDKKVINKPSDQYERPVSEALCVFLR